MIFSDSMILETKFYHIVILFIIIGGITGISYLVTEFIPSLIIACVLLGSALGMMFMKTNTRLNKVIDEYDQHYKGSVEQ